MPQFDPKKLEVALKYVERMTEGKNPVNNQPLEEDAVISNPNVIRCMLFIKEVLGAVAENKGSVGSRSFRADASSFPFECLQNFVYEKDKSISHLLTQVKNLTGQEGIKGIAPRTVTDCLKQKGYLREQRNPCTASTETVVTEEGMALGLYLEEHVSLRGDSYNIVMYNRNAQEFVISNLEAIVKKEGL